MENLWLNGLGIKILNVFWIIGAVVFILVLIATIIEECL